MEIVAHERLISLRKSLIPNHATPAHALPFPALPCSWLLCQPSRSIVAAYLQGQAGQYRIIELAGWHARPYRLGSAGLEDPRTPMPARTLLVLAPTTP